MKIITTISLSLAIILTITFSYLGIKSNYEYTKDYYSNWTLADKASTISQKAEYINKFVESLNNSGLQGSYNALIFTTPDNSFDQNFKALKSLQSRLESIKTMDENSFQYQSAIQQITAQEQGQAEDMLSVFSGCWYKVHYPILWGVFGGTLIIFIIICWSLGVSVGLYLLSDLYL